MPIWLNDPANWWGPNGVAGAHPRAPRLHRADRGRSRALIALPHRAGHRAHRSRRRCWSVGLANGLRGRPDAGSGAPARAIWLSPEDPPHCRRCPAFVRARRPARTSSRSMIVLVLLAIPPILTNTYAGVQNVDPAVRDAARGMGMTGWQVVRKVEFPCALPLIMSGIRSATLQVIATVDDRRLRAVPRRPRARSSPTASSQLTDLQSAIPPWSSAGIAASPCSPCWSTSSWSWSSASSSRRGVSGRFQRQSHSCYADHPGGHPWRRITDVPALTATTTHRVTSTAILRRTMKRIQPRPRRAGRDAGARRLRQQRQLGQDATPRPRPAPRRHHGQPASSQRGAPAPCRARRARSPSARPTSRRTTSSPTSTATPWRPRASRSRKQAQHR